MSRKIFKKITLGVRTTSPPAPLLSKARGNAVRDDIIVGNGL